MQTVFLRMLCSATSLKQSILKRIRLNEQIEQIQQKMMTEPNADSKDSQQAILSVLQRDAVKIEGEFLNYTDRLSKSMEHVVHWLRK